MLAADGVAGPVAAVMAAGGGFVLPCPWIPPAPGYVPGFHVFFAPPSVF